MSPATFADAWAHPGDRLVDHLCRVADQAATTLGAANESARRIAIVAGLCHDVGKASSYFQQYLGGEIARGPTTTHAAVGALLAWWAAGPLPTWERLAAFLAVLRHHGNLRASWIDELKRFLTEAMSGALPDQLAALDCDGARAFIRGAMLARGLLEPPAPPEDLLSILPRSTRLLEDASFDLGRAIDFLAAFGALLVADKVDTALAGAPITARRIAPDAVRRHCQRAFAYAASEMDRRRTAISRTIDATLRAHPDHRLFTLTSPTGSGKTLAILNAALARGAGERRIIYCLPFTSVIDQNARVFADVLESTGATVASDLLLKHHHLSDKSFTGIDEEGDRFEHDADGAGRLLTESWQSALVVTTFHQLLHSLLSARNRDLKRAGQLAGAIVLLDEVQAIPLRYWQAVRNLMVTTSLRLGTTFVLLTATRPLIFDEGDAVELLPDHERHYRALSRVVLHCHHHDPIDLDTFAASVVDACGEAGRSCLVIVNRKRAVGELYGRFRAELPGWTIRALSTLVRPCDRLQRIREIREELASGARMLVVSTQLVEAGVDFSFPVVHRDLAPLDAIVQAAGRCNRHGEGVGAVHLWRLVDERGRPLWQRVYDGLLIDATEEVLGDAPRFDEQAFLQLALGYFRACRYRSERTPVDELLAHGAFADLSRDFQLIEETPTRSVFVALDAEDRALWARWRSWLRDPARGRHFAEEQAFFERVVQVPRRGEPEPVRLVDGEGYDRELGLVIS